MLSEDFSDLTQIASKVLNYPEKVVGRGVNLGRIAKINS
jgi:hypothetical protein